MNGFFHVFHFNIFYNIDFFFYVVKYVNKYGPGERRQYQVLLQVLFRAYTQTFPKICQGPQIYANKDFFSPLEELCVALCDIFVAFRNFS